MKMKITRWDTEAVIYEAEALDMKTLLQCAVADNLDCYRARLDGASLDGARLDGARLVGASLDGARLDGARLDGAKYGNSVMAGPLIQIGNLAEWGSGFIAYVAKDEGLRIICGCRHFSIAEAHKHWKNRTNRVKTRVALDMAEVWFKSL